MQYPPGVDVVEVIIEVDTSAFEAAMKAPRVEPVTLGAAFLADLEAVRRVVGSTDAELGAFIAATSHPVMGWGIWRR